MNLDACVPIKDQKERHNPFFEVISAEKHLWPLIHSKGLLQAEVQDWFHKARAGYEKIILNDQEDVELQDVEYSLWKLHYKHIDEFRKRIDSHMEPFKSFLSEATEFYQDLITKLRRCYGLPEDPSFYDKGGVLSTVDPIKLHKCQHSCYRFLVCLGDLARYRELCKKRDFGRHNWSVAANYYFKATLVWPDSGNPQNQLALLATYVGDDFLALYHCMRSLAIKEPFRDSWDNLLLLFDKNRSSHLHSLSREAQFNFLNPSERSTSLMESQSSGDSLNSENISSAKSDLWPFFVRMISFFFIESSFEEFPCTFASTIRELDSLLALDDTKLKDTMESYQQVDSTMTGPYRALQMVSVLIFVIDRLTKSLDHKESKEKNNVQRPMLMQSALTATFICLGRLVERCLGYNPIELSPLLPGVLVFVEWLVGMLDKLETYGAIENVGSAMSYFYNAFVDLLNQLDKNDGEFKYQDYTALWEDYELRGFAPVAHAHWSVDFTTNPRLMGYFDSRNACRANRIFHAAMQIVDRSDDSLKLIFYDNLGRKFYKGVAEFISDVGVKEAQKTECGATEENWEDIIGEDDSHLFENGKAIAIEEEEVILFKPITRYNSAPLYTSTTDDEMYMEGINGLTAPSDECLCRASSLFIAQNQAQIDPLSFHSDTSNFRNKSFKQQDPLLKDTSTYPTGPPSLSAWVLNGESSNIEKEKGTKDFCKPRLNPIDEIASDSLTGLSLRETEDSRIDFSCVSSATTPYSPPPYLTPLPSAPLLPDDAIWFSGNSSRFSEANSSGNIEETDGILGTSPLNSYTNRSATHGPFGFGPSVPDLNRPYQPVLGMSSSEWLHQYTNQNIDQASSQVWPVHFCAPGRLGNFYGQDGSRFDLCDWGGNPLSSNRMVYLERPQPHAGSPFIYGADEQRRDKLFHNYQKLSAHGCGAVTDLRAKQPPVLQYLKEKEWQLQQQSQLRGPTYMGN